MQKKTAQKDDFLRTALYVGAAFLIYKLVKKIGGVIQDPLGTEQANEDLGNAIQVNEANLTYPLYQYISWATALEQALLIDLTEDEAVVDSIIFRMQNDDDYKQLVKTFGVRIDYTLGYIPSYSYTLPSAILTLTPERVNDYNNHFAGWNMTSRI
jgi:hypothetical protein